MPETLIESRNENVTNRNNTFFLSKEKPVLTPKIKMLKYNSAITLSTRSVDVLASIEHNNNEFADIHKIIITLLIVFVSLGISEKNTAQAAILIKDCARKQLFTLKPNNLVKRKIQVAVPGV